MNFIQAIQYCIENNLVFVAYQLPNSDAVRLVVQKNPDPVKVDINSKRIRFPGRRD
jgi:hypothetical protein